MAIISSPWQIFGDSFSAIEKLSDCYCAIPFSSIYCRRLKCHKWICSVEHYLVSHIPVLQKLLWFAFAIWDNKCKACDGSLTSQNSGLHTFQQEPFGKHAYSRQVYQAGFVKPAGMETFANAMTIQNRSRKFSLRWRISGIRSFKLKLKSISHPSKFWI